ncbi:hypothetical protein D3C80_1578700 [compost metagenome]
MTPLSKLKNLTAVRLDDVPVSDFNWITGLNKLTTLLFSHINVKDFSPLLKLKNLQEIYVPESDNLDLSIFKENSKVLISRSDDYFSAFRRN